ncbi:carbonic anhydrase [Amycolatopsis nigrescens]|uniref:carbonic anhydrase n=1 Tax=Amycolatopsis nigrescens TaxID=381445 RepID=UPI0003A71C4F|nr:carbonic anhydrase [Amycolatopsis nigrescens]
MVLPGSRALTRRHVFGLTTLAAGGGLLSACASADRAAATSSSAAPAPTAPPSEAAGAVSGEDAWKQLLAGNTRFIGDQPTHPHQAAQWRSSLVQAQHPFACVLGCGDSRVTPELVFDTGLGDVFTVRSAGEVLDDAVLGSIEYSVEHVRTNLVVVLGHAGCGAVSAAIDLVRHKGEVTGNIATLVRAVEPAVLATPPDPDPGKFLTACVAEQARRVKTELAERSEIIRDAVAQRGLKVVAATYDLADGKVSELT